MIIVKRVVVAVLFFVWMGKFGVSNLIYAGCARDPCALSGSTFCANTAGTSCITVESDGVGGGTCTFICSGDGPDPCAGELGCVRPCCYDACCTRGNYCYDVIECGFFASCNHNYCCKTHTHCDPNHCFAACCCPVDPPVCSSAEPESATVVATNGSFYAYAYGVVGATRVKFPTWTSEGGQDDLIWYQGVNMGGGTWRATIDLARHSEDGLVNVHVYMDNAENTNMWCDSANFTRTGMGEIIGTVYYDPNNTCSTSTPQEVGGALSVALRGTAYSAGVGGNGGYSMEALAGTYNYLDLNGMSEGFACSTGCMQGCPTATSVISPSVGNNFFLTDNAEAWWQTVGAGVYAGNIAGGITIDSDLPLSTTRLVIPGTNDLAAVVRASGSVSVGEGEISDENWSVTSPYKGKRMDYRYFANRMGVTPGTTTEFSSGTLQESEISGLEQDFYYSEDTGDNEVSLANAWTVTSGESYVIFVDGDLRINNNVTVEPGGFLTFVVNGRVVVSTNVTEMQGLYVMNGVFVTETLDPVDDAQLVVEGTVVAWGGVSLNRYLGGLVNRTNPAEQFVYRTDLLTNMPDKFKGFAMNWQEVVPGTFD